MKVLLKELNVRCHLNFISLVGSFESGCFKHII